MTAETATAKTDDGAGTVTATTAGAATADGFPTSSLGDVTDATDSSAKLGIDVCATMRSATGACGPETGMDFGKRAGKGVGKARSRPNGAGVEFIVGSRELHVGGR